MNLRAYFAHPWVIRKTKEKEKIINILKERKVDVVDPFEGEKKYYPETPRQLGRNIWIKDLRQIRESNLFVVYLPEDSKYKGCFAELQYALILQQQRKKLNKKMREKHGIGIHRKDKPYLIQIITKDRHPLIAYALHSGNQLFNTIEDFEKLRESNW